LFERVTVQKPSSTTSGSILGRNDSRCRSLRPACTERVHVVCGARQPSRCHGRSTRLAAAKQRPEVMKARGSSCCEPDEGVRLGPSQEGR